MAEQKRILISKCGQRNKVVLTSDRFQRVCCLLGIVTSAPSAVTNPMRHKDDSKCAEPTADRNAALRVRAPAPAIRSSSESRQVATARKYPSLEFFNFQIFNSQVPYFMQAAINDPGCSLIFSKTLVSFSCLFCSPGSGPPPRRSTSLSLARLRCMSGADKSSA